MEATKGQVSSSSPSSIIYLTIIINFQHHISPPHFSIDHTRNPSFIRCITWTYDWLCIFRYRKLRLAWYASWVCFCTAYARITFYRFMLYVLTLPNLISRYFNWQRSLIFSKLYLRVGMTGMNSCLRERGIREGTLGKKILILESSSIDYIWVKWWSKHDQMNCTLVYSNGSGFSCSPCKSSSAKNFSLGETWKSKLSSSRSPHSMLMPMFAKIW